MNILGQYGYNVILAPEHSSVVLLHFDTST